MAYEEFFTDGDKPYSENLNDSLVLTDAFDLSVPLCMPDGFSNGEFNSTLNVTRKCNVGLVTLKSVDNGVTIGTDSISGTGSVVFRVYPNFNCFYKWDKVIVEKSGTVGISFRKPDGSGITATVGSDGTISDSSALKQLVEVDLVLTLSDASISQICVWFVNNHNKSVRTGALLEASQLANVDGEVVSGETKAVNGGTVKTALDNLHTTVTGEIEDLSDSVTSDLNSLSNSVNNKLALKEDVSNKVNVFDNDSSHYPNNKAMEYLLEIIRDIVNVNIVPDLQPRTSKIYLKGQITYSFLSQVFIQMYHVNKSTGESKMACAVQAPASSGTFSEEVKVNPEEYNYYFKVISPINSARAPVLFVSPVYDKDNNIVG